MKLWLELRFFKKKSENFTLINRLKNSENSLPKFNSSTPKINQRRISSILPGDSPLGFSSLRGTPEDEGILNKKRRGTFGIEEKHFDLDSKKGNKLSTFREIPSEEQLINESPKGAKEVSDLQNRPRIFSQTIYSERQPQSPPDYKNFQIFQRNFHKNLQSERIKCNSLKRLHNKPNTAHTNKLVFKKDKFFGLSKRDLRFKVVNF